MGGHIVSGEGTGLNNSVVKCMSGEGLDAVLDDFTITRKTPGAVPRGLCQWVDDRMVLLG